MQISKTKKTLPEGPERLKLAKRESKRTFLYELLLFEAKEAWLWHSGDGHALDVTQRLLEPVSKITFINCGGVPMPMRPTYCVCKRYRVMMENARFISGTDERRDDASGAQEHSAGRRTFLRLRNRMLTRSITSAPACTKSKR